MQDSGRNFKDFKVVSRSKFDREILVNIHQEFCAVSLTLAPSHQIFWVLFFEKINLYDLISKLHCKHLFFEKIYVWFDKVA